MKKVGNTRVIHLIMLALLIVVIWVAYQRVSLVLKHKAQKDEKAKPFTSHIIDEKKAAQIKHARQLAEKAELLTHLTQEERDQVIAIAQEIDALEEQYLTPSSPAIALLGPIGTANVVLKEQGLERNIVIKLNELGEILQQHFAQKHKGPFQPTNDLTAALAQIKHLLKH